MTKPLKQYQQELEEEINELRLSDGKKIVAAEHKWWRSMPVIKHRASCEKYF